jgi:mono/diheme cytochrome c family protein
MERRTPYTLSEEDEMRIGKRITQWTIPVLLVAAVGACADKGDTASESADTTSAAVTTPAPAPETAAPAAGGAVAANLPAGVTPAMVQEGQQIFTSNGTCFTCHGANAEGTALAPSLTDSEWLWVTPGPNEYADLQTRIKEGVPQPKAHPAPMPPMGGATLTDDQVAAVAAYVWSLTNKG